MWSAGSRPASSAAWTAPARTLAGAQSNSATNWSGCPKRRTGQFGQNQWRRGVLLKSELVGIRHALLRTDIEYRLDGLRSTKGARHLQDRKPIRHSADPTPSPASS